MDGQGKEIAFSIQQKIKRSQDLVVSIILLVALSPFMLVVAAAIMISSPGGAIYRQKRIGKDGRPFYLYKFRSMVNGCNDGHYLQYLSDLIESERDDSRKKLPYRKMNDDPRITRVGKIIRRFYIDELPQLINILKGEMSLVGPRPHVQLEVDHYLPNQQRRLSVLPGVTGLWQAEGKVDCSFNQLISLDLYYIDHWSLGLDYKILYETFAVLLHGGEKRWARLHRKAQPERAPGLLIPVTSAKRPAEEPAQRIKHAVETGEPLYWKPKKEVQATNTHNRRSLGVAR